MNYWETLHNFVQENKIIIDRPKGSTHPRFSYVIYPLDYGYLENTSTIDGAGIDIFIGSLDNNIIQGILCSVDGLKKDAEIKILYKCKTDEIQMALDFLNKGWMRSIFIQNPMVSSAYSA